MTANDQAKPPATDPGLHYRGHILVVDDEEGVRDWLSIYLKRQGHEVATAPSGEAALRRLATTEFDLVISDLRMDEVSGLDVLRSVKERTPHTEVVVITAYATPETAIEAMKAGAYDYLTKPFKIDEIHPVIRRALEKRALVRANTTLRLELVGRHRFEDLIGKSAAMTKVFTLARRVADAPATVLITGESGTGKELVARAIHQASPRARARFVAVNCAAIPENLLEAELFGHVRGAFTGAVSDAEGVFFAADGGTLVLDEIGELPLGLQVKLLRALQERQIKPVGGSRARAVDVRVVAITNRDLEAEVRAGAFREDLFYRINVIHIHVPPLRERREDIPLLVHHFVRKFNAAQNKSIERVEPDALQGLLQYPFPGNVRELENLVERAITLETAPVLTAQTLAPPPTHPAGPAISSAEIPAAGVELDGIIEAVEREYISRALEMSGGVRKEAAKLLGISFRSLRYRLSKLGIDK